MSLYVEVVAQEDISGRVVICLTYWFPENLPVSCMSERIWIETYWSLKTSRQRHRLGYPGSEDEKCGFLLCGYCGAYLYWGRVKRKSAFEHAQNVRIHTILRIIQRLWQWTAKWTAHPGPSLSVHAPKSQTTLIHCMKKTFTMFKHFFSYN